MTLVFDLQNPFPLLAQEPEYRLAQEHAAAVDAWLGFEFASIERDLSATRVNYSSARDEQHWIGLPIQTLQTPYTEIRFLLSHLDLRAGHHLVDLGAGYGRMGFVIAAHYPDVQFTGYEVVPERVAEGLRVWRKSHQAIESKMKSGIGPSLKAPFALSQADLSDPNFKPKVADFYFLYDFGSREAIEKTLNDLKEIASSQPITVIGRGRSSRDAIEREHPWLSQVNTPSHFDHFSIYRS